MKSNTLVAAFGLFAPASALIRFGCGQLTVQRLDPLVEPGNNPSGHLHQIVGGNSFNVTMDYPGHDLVSQSTCTTCQFTEDLSNYWTAVMFFRARNGSFHRVPQIPQQGFTNTKGGMVVYYMSDALFDTAQRSTVTAFKPGFRMVVGDVSYRSKEQSEARNRQLTFTCMESQASRAPEYIGFPPVPCKGGIMANHRFPTCWDGVNLDSPNHHDHVAYPESGTFESGGPCPATHPVKLPQLMLETVWDTSQFNDKSQWPEDGTQPFFWSSGDPTGFSSHADYVFGWKEDSLQKAMDSHSYVTASNLHTQAATAQNACSVKDMVGENFDGWLNELPGIVQAG